MVYKCCVPNCRGNYSNGPKVQLFSFPKEEDLCQKWIRAIHRDNFVHTQYTKVCELHFAEENIQRETECYDERTGSKLKVLLQRPRLKIGAIPSKFPNCPQYISTPTSTRESAEERRTRIDNKNLEAAISESLVSKSQYERERHFSNYDEFLACLEKEVIVGWSIIKMDNLVTFAVVELTPSPVISVSAVFDKDLNLSVFKGNVPLKTLGKHTFPKVLTNINDLVGILEMLKLLSSAKESSVQDHLDIVHDILIQLRCFLDDGKQKNLDFIIEQLYLLNCKQERFRYSPHLSIFCSILFCISPHAYKFIRSSGNVIFPHPRTIKKICATYNSNPQIEQSNENFLSYIKQRFRTLKNSDYIVSLMIDEIHIKPYLDYKAGNILGAAYNTEDAATTAYVFMIQSLLSSFKEVVHILPIKTINADKLFVYIKKTIIGLQSIGFKVICVVSDNNSLNRKSMSYFSSPPKLSIVYQHPSDPNAPLFFIIDSVHILKSIRNNWINQKDSNESLMYPSFENHLQNEPLLIASFTTLKHLYQIESSALLKYSYGMSMKSLYPSNLEKQNVKFVLGIFNQYVVQGLLTLGGTHNLHGYKTTADFINLICSWWSVVNVKTVNKGIRLKDSLQKPLTLCKDEENYLFLEKFLIWLNLWKELSSKNNCLTRETHLALTHTTYGLLEMARYCIDELHFEYFLPGKIQTDALEARFGKYRTMAGSQYLISIRQIFEIESKLRMQNYLPLKLKSDAFGEFDVNTERLDTTEYQIEDHFTGASFTSDFDIDYLEEDFLSIEPFLPVLTYLSGYCARASMKKMKCQACSKVIVLEKELCSIPNDSYALVRNMDRGGLLLPHPDIVTAVMYNYITVQKLIEKKYEKMFLSCNNQRKLVLNLTLNIVNSKDFFLNSLDCIHGHSEVVLNHVLVSSTNALLNNYVKKKNDKCNQPVKKKRKINTVKKNILDCNTITE